MKGVFSFLIVILAASASKCTPEVRTDVCSHVSALNLTSTQAQSLAKGPRTTSECQAECLASCEYDVVGEKYATCVQEKLQGCSVTVYDRYTLCPTDTCLKINSLYRFSFDSSPLQTRHRSAGWLPRLFEQEDTDDLSPATSFTPLDDLDLVIPRREYSKPIENCDQGTFRVLPANAEGYAALCAAGVYPAVKGETVTFRMLSNSQMIINLRDWYRKYSEDVDGADKIDIAVLGCCALQVSDAHEPRLYAYRHDTAQSFAVYPVGMQSRSDDAPVALSFSLYIGLVMLVTTAHII